MDDIEHGEPLETFGQIVTEFLETFEQEEREDLYQAPIMKECWSTGSFWYFEALHSPKGLCRIFNEHIQRLFCLDHCRMRMFDQIVALYWAIGAAKVERRRSRKRKGTRIN